MATLKPKCYKKEDTKKEENTTTNKRTERGTDNKIGRIKLLLGYVWTKKEDGKSVFMRFQKPSILINLPVRRYPKLPLSEKGQQLVDMGYQPEIATFALRLNEYDVTVASNWLMDNNDRLSSYWAMLTGRLIHQETRYDFNISINYYTVDHNKTYLPLDEDLLSDGLLFSEFG